jgi:hypothetical protein
MSSFLDFLSKIGGPELSMLGTAMSVGGAVAGGIEARQAAGFQADQLRINAGQAQASAQRSAIDIDRQTQMVVSRALAVAAASGGGASDPTVVNMIAQDAAEGAYRKAVALYQGDDAARGMKMQADAKEHEGAQSLVTGGLSGASNLLTGMSRQASLYQRFGGGGPDMRSMGPGKS